MDTAAFLINLSDLTRRHTFALHVQMKIDSSYNKILLLVLGLFLHTYNRSFRRRVKLSDCRLLSFYLRVPTAEKR